MKCVIRNKICSIVACLLLSIFVSKAQTGCLQVNPSIQSAACFDSLTGSITTNVSGGTPAYVYNWSNGETGSADTALGMGTYLLTVTDASGCSVTETFNITQPTQLIITQPIVQNTGCAGGNTGAISVQAAQGTPGYTYAWEQLPGAQTYNTQNLSNLSPGSYYLTVTDAKGCTDTASYSVDTIPFLRYLDSVGIVSCYGGSNGAAKISVISGTRPYVFTWDYGTSTTDSIIINLSAGPVEVIIADSNDCQAQVFLNVPQPNLLTVQLVSDTNVSCFGGSNGSLTVNAVGGTPGYDYTWDNNETGETDTGLILGQYQVQVSDTNGCTASQVYNISQPTALSINAPDIQDIGCAGGNTGSITANVSNGTPGYTYDWLQEQSGQIYTGRIISSLPVGTYFLEVTDANGCVDTTSYPITAIPLLTFTVDSTNVSCNNGNNGSAQVSITSGTPPYEFSYDNGPYVTDSFINNLTAGNLQINVTDSNTCLTEATIYISQPGPIAITQLSQTNVTCNGGNNGQLTVSVNGGTAPYSYIWNNQVSDTVNSNLIAATYTFAVLDNNDCPDTAQYIIIQPTPIVTDPIVKNDLCYFGNDGSIDANPSGGTPGYTYLWSNGETSQVATGLVKNSYSCTVSDFNLCTVVFTDTIGQPSRMIITADTITRVKCYGQNNGTAVISATGDTPPYYYAVTNDGVNFIYSTNGVILGLDTGIYTVQVSDSNGCIADTFINVPPAIPDEFYPPVADSTLCYGPDYNDGGVLVIDSTIQNGPYQYSIDGGILQDTGYFQNLSTGPHLVIAVSAYGCVDSIPVFIPEPLPVEAIVTPDSITLPLGGSQQVLVTYENATNPSYSWANTLGFSCDDCPNPVVSSYAPGAYVVTVSMVNGTATCYGSTTLYVNVLGHTGAFIPNAFTPNGDGVDDLFQIYGEDIKTASMKVFNRWGELVYSTTNSLAGWDGTYKGQPQMSSVFTYEAVITYLDNSQQTMAGSVTLIR